MQGLQLEAINATVVASESVHVILKKLDTVGRPLTLQFRETPEFRVLGHLFDKFMLADKDGSGVLDRDEVADVLRGVYRAGSCLSCTFAAQLLNSPLAHTERMSRNRAAVLKEVDAAMHEFDQDGSGCLEFNEFIRMLCASEAIKLPLADDAKTQVIELANLLEATWVRQTNSPQQRRNEWVRHNKAAVEIEALTDLFHSADASGDGRLDESELTQVVCGYYKEKGDLDGYYHIK